MKYIDKIKQMSVNEMASFLKNLIDNYAEKASKEVLEKVGYTNVNIISHTKLEDFIFCLENEVEE